MKISRRTVLCPKFVFTPSVPGSGKSLIGAVLTGLERVEIQRLIPFFEYVCNIWYLKKIEDDAAESLIRLFADFFCYNIMTSRDVSFRPLDWTSALKDPNRVKYIERLFLPDGDDVFKRIDEERPLIQNTSHLLLSISDPVIKALGDRWFFVETFRHPIFLVHHWFHYVDRYGTDSREFSVCFDHKGRDLPWFAFGWEDEYANASTMDRAILCVNFLQRRHFAAYDRIKAEHPNQITCYAFENFVVNPWPVIEELEKLLDTKRSEKMAQLLKEQKIPREVPTDGPIDVSWITRHGQKALSKGDSVESEYERHWALAKKYASNECLNILEKLCSYYEDRFFRSKKNP